MTEINYLGTYTDEAGNDVIRLELDADTRSYTTSWMDNVVVALKFPKKLFEAIDWNKSYVYSGKGTEEHFNFNSVKKSDYQAGISFTQINNGWLNQFYELPINLILKDGTKVTDLGKEDFLVQHRALDTKNNMILTNVPGNQRDVNLNEIEYGQFTKSTIVPLNSNIDNTIIPANSNKVSNKQRYGSSEYDSDRKIIKVKHHYRKSDSLDSYLGNVGFTQSFDARLLDLLVEDARGNVAYLDVNTIDDEKAYGTTPKVAITRGQINVKDGVATIYVVGSSFQSNLEKSGLKVIRATSGGITTGIYSVLFKTGTVNYVNTTIEYNIDEDRIAKLFPANKYLKSYAFKSGFIHENKNGFLLSEQTLANDIVIPKGSKLTLEFNDRINSAGNQYVMQIGETYHVMNDAAAPHNAREFETITERNVGGLLSSNRDMKYDINMVSGRTLHAGDPIKLWIINDNGQKYTSHGWRLFINTGNPLTDKNIIRVQGGNFKRDYNPTYFQHSKSVDGVMVTKYKYVPQVEEIFDTDSKIKGSVLKDKNVVTAYYKTRNGKFYSIPAESQDLDFARPITLDYNGKEVENGPRLFNPVFNYELEKLKHDTEELKLMKDMPIRVNTARKGQFPSDPTVEPVQSVISFDLNGGELADVKSFEGYNDEITTVNKNVQYTTRKGYNTLRASAANSTKEDVKAPVKRIVPMNERYFDDDNYVANAFEGANIKNMSYVGDAEELRKFAEDPAKADLEFYGWTTTKLSDNDVAGYNKLKELTAKEVEKVVEARKAVINKELEITDNIETAAKLRSEATSLKAQAKELEREAANKNEPEKTIILNQADLYKKQADSKESEAKVLDEKLRTLNIDLNTAKAAYNKAQDEFAENDFKFTKNSPVLESMTVYAFYGPFKSEVTNPKQTYDDEADKQYIEIEAEDGSLPANANYKLVTKNEDGTYNEVVGLTITQKADGTPAFDITDIPSDKFDPNKEYYIETKEEGKQPSYSDNPINIDKVAPTFVKDQDGNELIVKPDELGYYVEVSTTAEDEAGILRVYVNDEKEDGYHDAKAEKPSAGLDKTPSNLQGEEKEFTVTAVDKFGNKATVKYTQAKTLLPLPLGIDRPYKGDDAVYVQTKQGASLKITVYDRRGNEKFTMTATQDTDGISEIKLLNSNNEPYELADKGGKVVIEASLDGWKSNIVTSRIR